MDKPGKHLTGCEWLADMRGWTLRHGNVMVEGTSDVEYFTLAAQLHLSATGLSLLGDDLSIFAAGQGDEGGTYGISERFPALFEVAGLDLDAAGKRKFRVIALLDDDDHGRRAISGITAGHRRIKEYATLFRLRRVMPPQAGSPKVLAERTKQENQPYGTLDCVIEDLLDPQFCECFLQETSRKPERQPKTFGQTKHYLWSLSEKADLLRFAKQDAILSDVGKIIDVLKSLRTYLELPQNGIPVRN